MAKRRPPPKSKGLSTIPSQVQLPGGIVLKAMPFMIVAYNDDGSPQLFRLAPPGPHDMTADGACVLFAQEEWIRAAQPDKVKTPKVLNEFEQAYVDEIEQAKGVRMLTCGEWSVLEFEVDSIRDGTMELGESQTLDERLERLRNHYP